MDVKNVEGRDAGFETEPLADPPFLTERQVPLMEWCADQRTRPHVAKSSLSRRNDHRLPVGGHIASICHQGSQSARGSRNLPVHGGIHGLRVGRIYARCWYGRVAPKVATKPKARSPRKLSNVIEITPASV